MNIHRHESTARRVRAALTALILVAAAACDDSRTYDPVGPFGDPSAVVGSGNVVQQVIPVGSFAGIELAGIGTVVFEQGGGEQVRLEAEENLVPYLHAEVLGNLLVVSKDPLTLRPTRPVVFYVRAPELDELTVTGAGDIEASGLAGTELALRLLGVGGIDLVGIDYDRVDASLGGVGTVRLSGRADWQRAVLTGTASYEAGNLASRVAEIELRGIGSATVRVSEHLTAILTGSGSLSYYGDPTVDSSAAGSGRLIHLGG